MKLNCIIIDDEPLARKGLSEYIGDVDFLHLSGEYDQALKATDLIATGMVHLLFLDIQMPRITGLDYFKTLKNAPPVIFTTAYPQYALEGFDLNALDYLAKPVSFDRFLKAALRAKEYYELRNHNEANKVIGKKSTKHQEKNAAEEKPEDQDHFFIKSDNKLVRIFYDDVLFVEALQNYVLIHTKERKHITYLTFHSVEEYLPEHLFIKTHKSYIIALSKVESIEGNEIRMGSHHIPISRNLKEDVMKKLLGNRFLKR
jgi:DNA-binding LytR/AlgR family response regulator